MENNNGPKYFFSFMFGFCMCGLGFSLSQNRIKENTVAGYIQHPENYKIEYLTYKGDTTGIIVTYLK